MNTAGKRRGLFDLPCCSLIIPPGYRYVVKTGHPLGVQQAAILVVADSIVVSIRLPEGHRRLGLSVI